MFCWSSRRVATTSSGESPAERWAADDLAPCIDITYPWGEAKETIRHGDTWTSGAFRIRVFAGFSRLSSASLIILDPAHRIAIFGGTSALDALGHEAIEEWLQAAREKCVRDELQSDGYLRTAAQGLSRGAFWNTIWEPARNRPLPVFSRRWCVNFGGWVDAPADNFAQARRREDDRIGRPRDGARPAITGVSSGADSGRCEGCRARQAADSRTWGDTRRGNHRGRGDRA